MLGIKGENSKNKSCRAWYQFLFGRALPSPGKGVGYQEQDPSVSETETGEQIEEGPLRQLDDQPPGVNVIKLFSFIVDDEAW